jgi:hypothetical protein
MIIIIIINLYVITKALTQHPESQLQRQHKNIKNANEVAHHNYNAWDNLPQNNHTKLIQHKENNHRKTTNFYYLQLA